MATLQRAVLVELDYAVLHGMKYYVDAANSVLSPIGVKVDAIDYARFLSGRTKASGVAALLKHAGVSKEAAPLASEILAASKKALVANIPEVKETCAKFVAALHTKNVCVVFVTQADAAEVTEALGDVVVDGVRVLQEPTQHVGGYSWDHWRRLCNRLNIHERLCAAVVGSGISAKGAMATGLYLTACIDPLAQDQDFSGVEVFSEAIDDKLAKELLRLLWQHT